MAKILIIDDDERILKLYSTFFRREGYEVLTALGAEKGIDLAMSAQPNLILLDVMMPSVDGTEALASLSGNARTKQIPVIFLTSLVVEGEVDDAQGEIGGHEFIAKSAPIKKIAARVKKTLADHAGKAEATALPS